MTAFEQILSDGSIEFQVSEARSNYLLEQVAPAQELKSVVEPSDGLLASAMESLALASNDVQEKDDLFVKAFLLRRESDLGSGLEGLKFAASLAADGVLANRSAEVLMLLRNYQVPDIDEILTGSARFEDKLFVRTLRAFILLVRRAGGWDDLRDAAHEITLLREDHLHASQLQGNVDDDANSLSSAVRLISGFNLAKIVDLASTYTASGQPSNVQAQYQRHAANRSQLSKYGPDPVFGLLGDLIEAAAGRLIESSIWTGTVRLGSALRDFVASLASHHRSNPVLELWPSQRQAIDSHLLDPARRAVVVEMPTSAGKTLIAEFSVIQAHALNPVSTVVYVVPTRALVNQITRRLRYDLRPLNLVVESAIPVFELDPTEDVFLRRDVNVLVTTPEKLDLLVKSGHPLATNISLAVIDEAHNLSDGVRGARLELLLGMLKRERPETRFLLLTPFVPNNEQLASWLGDGEESTITVDWRPSERLAVTAHWKKPTNKPYRLMLTTVDSAGNVDVEAGKTLVVGRPSEVRVTGKAATTVELVRALQSRGGVLVLVRGKGTAETRASEIAVGRPSTRNCPPILRAVVHFAEDELGADHLLPRLLTAGVAYHHAGLSHELRYLVEQLIDEGHVDVVVGTTTLAQGLNFPISSVIVETLTRSQGYGKPWKELTYSEFWNIAGRAGRAMRDPLGIVAFPCVNKADRDKVKEFLSGESTAVSSALLEAVSSLGSVANEFNLSFIRENPDLAVFLQYLTHVTRVGGAEQTAAELEDVLRSSLVFHQLSDGGTQVSSDLISIARQYVDSMHGQDRGFLALVDGTGFSLASARMIYGQTTSDFPEFRSSDFWSSENLFQGGDAALANVVKVLGDVPELRLGLTDDSYSTFDPAVVAGITRAWVTGASMQEIADRWFAFPDSNSAKRLRDASSYVHGKLVGQVPWGIGAIQKLVLSDESTDAGHVPSFVFYGVSSWEAVLMRMGGVPRSLAQSLGAVWKAQKRVPESFQELRTWLSQLPAERWGNSEDHDVRLSGEEAALVWRTLAGGDDAL